jgi:Lrp/AsnC family transcriptional regulator, leucine-responsive regulatory protein
MPRIELDDIDRRILAVLQSNNLIQADRLGERVGLSASSVQRRIKRLRQAKVIIEDVSIVDPKAIGQGAMFVVEVSLERESAEVVQEFKRRMRAAPEVQQCYYVTGDADFVLMVTARDNTDYENIIDRLFLEERNIRKFKTGVVLNRVKATLAVPVE